MNTKELKQAANGLNKIINRRVHMPIMASIMIERDSTGTIKLSSTNLDAWATVTLDTVDDNTEPFSVCVDAENLVSYIKATIDKTITFEIKGDRLHFSCYSLATLDSRDYPHVPSVDKSKWFKLDSRDMVDVERQLMPMAAGYDTSNILGGINFKRDGNVIDACSTDGSRLSHSKFRSNNSCGANDNFIVPVTLLKQVMPLIKGKDVKFSADKNNVMLTAGNTVAILRLIGGEYPRYEELFPGKSNYRVIFQARDVEAAIKRLLPVVDDRTNLVHMTLNGSFTITAPGNDPVNIDIPANMVNDGDMKLAVNVHYLLDAVKAFNSDDMVTIDYSAPLKPLIFALTGSGGETYRHLLMPVQAK